MNQFKQIALIVFLSLLLLPAGTLGYMVIEGWGWLDALYMTVITLATVGYGEVHPVSPTGRIFTIVLIFVGVGFCVYVAGKVIEFLMDGRIRHYLGRRKLDKQIDKLENHFIICGYGRIGKQLCGYLTQKYLDVVVIENNPEKVPVMDEDGVLYLAGEATDEAILAKAGIKRARALLTALATDADNVFLVLIAKRLNPDLFIVARAIQETAKVTLKSAGADKVVSPYDIGARRMAHAILRPTVIRFLEMAFTDEATSIQMEEIVIGPDSKLVGKSLLQSDIRKELNMIILAVKKSDGILLFNPAASTMLEAHDTVIAVGSSRNLKKLEMACYQ